MSRIFSFEGKQYSFPDDATDAEVFDMLERDTAPPSTMDVLASVPGAVNRGFIKTAAGIHRVYGDLTGDTEAQKTASAVNKLLEQEGQDATPRNMTLFQEGLHSGLISVGEQLPNALLAAAAAPVVATAATPAALATAAASIGTSVMGATTGLRKYADVRDAGFAGPRAGLSALFEGLVEKYTEFLPMKELTGGKVLWNEAKKFLWKDLTGEEIATTLQDINAKLHDRPDMTLGDYLRDVAVTAIATPIAAGTQMGAMKAGQAVVNSLTPQEPATTPPVVPPTVPPTTPPQPVGPVVPPEAPEAPPTSAGALLGTPIAPVEPPTGSSDVQVPVYALVPSQAATDPNFDGLVLASTDRQDVELQAQETGHEIVSATIPQSQLAEWAEQYKGKLQQAGALPDGVHLVPLGALQPGVTIPVQPASVESTTGSTEGEVKTPPGATVVSTTVEGGESNAQKRKGRKGGRRQEVLTVPTEQSQTPELQQQGSANPNPATLPAQSSYTSADGHEVSNYVTTRDSRGEYTLVFPDPYHHKLSYIAHRQGQIDRTKKLTKTKLARQLQAENAIVEVANQLGISADQVRELAPRYMEAWKNLAKQRVGKLVLAPRWESVAPDVKAQARAETNPMTPINAQFENITAVASNPGDVILPPEMQTDLHAIRLTRYIRAWIRVFAPTLRVQIVGYTAANTGAATGFKEGVHFLWLPPLSTTAQEKVTAVYDLAHEFGHMLVHEFLHRPKYTAVARDMRRDFDQLMADLPNLTIGQFLDRWASPGQYQDIANRGFDLEAPVQTLLDGFTNAGFDVYRDVLTFDEWTAEQMGRYVHSNQKTAFPVEVRNMWAEILEILHKFFNQVVKKLSPNKSFVKFIDELSPLADVRTGNVSVAPQAQSKPTAYFSTYKKTIYDSLDYTTKVLERLPNKPVILKSTVLAEINRQDVKADERELIKEVLDELPDRFPRDDLTYIVQNRLLPLHPGRIGQSTYTVHGYNSLKWSLNPLTGQTMPMAGADAFFTVWHSPFTVGPGKWLDHIPELGNDSTYWAHTRNVIRNQNGERIQTTAELQSDLMQQPRMEGIDDIRNLQRRLNTLANDLVGQINSGNFDSTKLSIPQVDVRIFYGTSTSVPVYEFRNSVYGYSNKSDRTRATSELYDATINFITALETLMAAEDAKEVLPQRWWESVLRHEKWLALKERVNRWRFPTIDTLIKIEWGSIREITRPVVGPARVVATDLHLKVPPGGVFGNELASEYKLLSWVDSNGLVTVTTTGKAEYVAHDDPRFAGYSNSGNPQLLVEVIFPDNTPDMVPIAALKRWKYNLTVDPASPMYIPDEADFFHTPPVPENVTYLPQAKAVIDNYRRNYIPFFNKEFGAKQITDEFGQTWWEAELNPDDHDIPVVYFQAKPAAADIAKNVAERGGVPELPKAYSMFQGFFNSFLQLNQMAKILPDVDGLQSYRRLMQSMHNLKNSLMEGPNQQIERWNRVPIKQAELVEDALREEERSGSHWTSLVEETIDVNGVPKQVWTHQASDGTLQLLKAKGINEEGINLFLAIKNDFLRVLTLMEDTVTQHTKQFFSDNIMLQTIRLRDVKQEFSQLRQVPYIPDPRFGNYAVEIHAGHEEVVLGRTIKKGELVYFKKFETEREQKAHYAKMKAEYGSAHKVSMYYIDDVVTQMTMMPRNFVEATINALAADASTALTPEQLNVLKAVQYDFTATGKFDAFLRKGRKGVGGAEEDLRRVYANYMWRTSNAISKLQFQPQLAGAIKQVSADAQTLRKTQGNSNEYDKLVEYMKKNFKYVFTPQAEWQNLRAFVSLWYLAAVPKTALMNFSSVPMITLPYLASRYGELSTVAEMIKAMKTVAQFWRNPDKVDANVKRALQQAKEDGVINQGFAAMLASVAEGGVTVERLLARSGTLKSRKGRDVIRTLIWRLVAAGMAPFRVVEQINRMVTLVAAYQLEAKKQNAQGFSPDAYEQARDAVDYTQNEFSPWNRPEFMRGRKGAALLFFSFVQNFAFLIYGGDKAWWRMMLLMAVAAGLQGLPGADNMIDIINWAWRKYSGQYKDLRNDAREVAESLGANPDLVMHGIANTSFGLGYDVSNSVGLGRIVPGTDAIFGIGKFEQRFLQAAGELGGPVGSLGIALLRAISDDNPDVLARLDSALPPAVRNLERLTRAIDQGGWVDQKGRMLVSDVTSAELVGQALGFSPTRKTVRQEELRAERDVAEFYTLRRQNLLALAYDARHSGDLTAWLDAKAAIDSYNEEVPEKSLRIGSSDISASLKARRKSAQEVERNQSPVKRYQALYNSVSGLYGE